MTKYTIATSTGYYHLSRLWEIIWDICGNGGEKHAITISFANLEGYDSVLHYSLNWVKNLTTMWIQCPPSLHSVSVTLSHPEGLPLCQRVGLETWMCKE